MGKKTKKILFVCVQNASRSQIAQGFAEAFEKGRAKVYSAGSPPSCHMNPLAIEPPFLHRQNGKREEGQDNWN